MHGKHTLTHTHTHRYRQGHGHTHTRGGGGGGGGEMRRHAAARSSTLGTHLRPEEVPDGVCVCVCVRKSLLRPAVCPLVV